MKNRNLWDAEEVVILLSYGPEKACSKLARSLSGCQNKYYKLTGRKSDNSHGGNRFPNGHPYKGKKYKPRKPRELKIVWFKNPDFNKPTPKKTKALKEKLRKLSTIENSGDLNTISTGTVEVTSEDFYAKSNSFKESGSSFVNKLYMKVYLLFNGL